MSKFKFSIYLGTICSYIVCAILCTLESYAHEANDREIRATNQINAHGQ